MKKLFLFFILINFLNIYSLEKSGLFDNWKKDYFEKLKAEDKVLVAKWLYHKINKLLLDSSFKLDDEEMKKISSSKILMDACSFLDDGDAIEHYLKFYKFTCGDKETHDLLKNKNLDPEESLLLIDLELAKKQVSKLNAYRDGLPYVIE